jgi:hypothetical protein
MGWIIVIQRTKLKSSSFLLTKPQVPKKGCCPTNMFTKDDLKHPSNLILQLDLKFTLLKKCMISSFNSIAHKTHLPSLF